MTSPARPSLIDRVLDIVFGQRLTSEQQARAEAFAPPRPLQTLFNVLYGASFLVLFVLILSRWNWLPVVESETAATWFWYVFGLNVLLRLGWDQVQNFYKRRAKAGKASMAASPE